MDMTARDMTQRPNEGNPRLSSLEQILPEQRRPNAPTVLVVDHDEATRNLIAVILECQGFIVLTAADGSTAISLVRERRPDLVTVSSMLPTTDGWQVARLLAADPATADVRCLVVTPSPMVTLDTVVDLDSPAPVPAHAVLTSPYDFVAFVEVIEQVLAAGSSVSAETNRLTLDV